MTLTVCQSLAAKILLPQQITSVGIYTAVIQLMVGHTNLFLSRMVLCYFFVVLLCFIVIKGKATLQNFITLDVLRGSERFFVL